MSDQVQEGSPVTGRPPLRDDLAAFARLTGWAYFPIAFVGRLPFAMMIVGILSVVATITGSVAEAGLAAAAAGTGTAAFGAGIGSLADRFGQRIVLVAASVISIGATATFLFLLIADAPLISLASLAFVAGGTTPQVAPFSRSRLATLAGTARAETTRSRAVSMVMSYESIVDEISFVIGPVLVGLLTALVAPWAPLALGALLTATVVTAFAFHPTAAAPQAATRPASTASTPAPSTRIFSARVVVLSLGMLLCGATFGSILTALTEFMTAREVGEQTGILYGAMSAGAILIAVALAVLPAQFSLTSRWIVFSGVAVLGSLGLVVAPGILSAGIALFFAGCGVGAVLVALFSLGAAAAPPNRSTTVLTSLQSTLVVGQALATAGGGIVSQEYGSGAGFLITASAAVALLAVACIYRWRFASQRA